MRSPPASPPPQAPGAARLREHRVLVGHAKAVTSVRFSPTARASPPRARTGRSACGASRTGRARSSSSATRRGARTCAGARAGATSPARATTRTSTSGESTKTRRIIIGTRTKRMMRSPFVRSSSPDSSSVFVPSARGPPGRILGTAGGAFACSAGTPPTSSRATSAAPRAIPSRAGRATRRSACGTFARADVSTSSPRTPTR